MSQTKYDHQKIEKKWQKIWEEEKPYQALTGDERPKYYVLDMFPYPSGAGLHVGHPVGYTASDIIARYKRACGFNVLHPMGWDSFGLPAEQYAVRTGTHPRITTEENITNYKRQLKSLGLAYDWDREIATSDPSFYKWTQWIFSQLYERGLAYEAEILVNYCPALGTVLANEEVENGLSKEGGHAIERRPLRQWMLKITEYAERLLKDLDLVDWPESIKRHQRNWIGRSEGALIRFDEIEVFTTSPHTIYGVTYLVLAPEHPLVDKIAQNREEVEAYREKTARKSDLERTELSKEKTGVFTGATAMHPVTGEQIPIWIADYVLASYGTGAIMAVPGHDERDREFAEAYDLPILPVIEEERMINSEFLNGLTVPTAIPAAISWLEAQGAGEPKVTYRLRDWLFSRQRYWGEPFPILHLADGSKRLLDPDELPLTPPEIDDFHPSGDGQSPLAKVRDWVEITDPVSGQRAKRETNTMPQWAGSCWYYLRFCDPQNSHEAWSKRAERYWLPVDLYIGGAEHAVLHLLYARFWHKVLYDLGHVSTPEPFARLFNQGLINARSYKLPGGSYVSPSEAPPNAETAIEKMSKSKLNVVNPDAIVAEQGADALRLYLMFMGPLDKDKIWETSGVSGCRRFLSRFYDLAFSPKLIDELSDEALRLGYTAIAGVTADIEALHFNTAIAKLMEFVNAFSKLPRYPREVLRMVTQVLAPLAPHIASEIWTHLKGEGSILTAPWPKIDHTYLESSTVTYIVQVNGKLRGRFDLPKDASQEKIESLARSDERISRHLEKPVSKVIFVPNKLVNFVTH